MEKKANEYQEYGVVNVKMNEGMTVSGEEVTPAVVVSVSRRQMSERLRMRRRRSTMKKKG